MTDTVSTGSPAASGTATSTSDDTVTTQLSNGLTCDLPASSPLAKLLRTQRTWVGPTAKERLAILRGAKSIAIVGASPNSTRSSYFVGTYLQQSSDYRVYFVNPHADTILGQKAYPDLASLPEVPDIVDVFRKASDIPSVIDDVVAAGAKTVWIQLGIWNQDAAIYGESKGLTVVMDRCIKVEHARFHGGLHLLGFDTGHPLAAGRRPAAARGSQWLPAAAPRLAAAPHFAPPCYPRWHPPCLLSDAVVRLAL
jgi:predicted CoA-binding protein